MSDNASVNTVTPLLQRYLLDHLLMNRVTCIPALDLLALLPDASVDLLLCDLPYAVTENEWDVIIPLEPMWEQFNRVVKPLGAIVLTAIQPFTSMLIMSNLPMFKYTWVWVKTKASDHINAKNRPMRKHEDVLVFSHGTTANCSPTRMNYNPQGLKPSGQVKFRPNGTINTRNIGRRPSHVNEYVQEFEGYPDTVLEFANGNNFNVHPTQKPEDLFEYLIRTYTQEGDLVVDPCVGSGTTAVAARNTKRRFICGDTELDYVLIARDRLRLPFEKRHAPQNDDVSDLPIFAGMVARKDTPA